MDGHADTNSHIYGNAKWNANGITTTVDVTNDHREQHDDAIAFAINHLYGNME